MTKLAWNKTSWGEIATLEYGKGLRGYKNAEGNYPVFGTNGQIGWHDEYLYPDEGVIVGRKGAYRGIHYSKKPFFVIDTAFYLNPLVEDTLDLKWAYYQLLDFDINKMDSGSAIPSTSREAFYAIEFCLPPLHTQRKIASILSAYDDLIENNLRRIKILEEMAQNLYREWFVKFRFPGHEKVRFVDSPQGKIPEGWEVKPILEYADVVYGFPFRSNQFNTSGEGLPVIRIRDLPKGQSQTYTQEEGEVKHRVHNGDILVGMDGDFHMTIWSGGHAWQNQRVCRFHSRGRLSNYHLFLALIKPIKFFNSTITGTTVAHLGHKHIRTIKIIVPTSQILDLATKMLDPLAEEQLNLRLRNTTLRRTRDLLLPKLISGELDVSDLNIDIGDLEEAIESKADIQKSSEDRTRSSNKTDPAKPVEEADGDLEQKDVPQQRPAPIEDWETDEVMAVFRSVGRGRGFIERADFVRLAAAEIGYKRLSPQINSALKGHLRAAVRRGVLESDSDSVRIVATSMTDYEPASLISTLTTVVHKGGLVNREEAIRQAAEHLGFRRVTEGTNNVLKKAVRIAILRGVLAGDREHIWRND